MNVMIAACPPCDKNEENGHGAHELTEEICSHCQTRGQTLLNVFSHFLLLPRQQSTSPHPRSTPHPPPIPNSPSSPLYSPHSRTSQKVMETWPLMECLPSSYQFKSKYWYHLPLPYEYYHQTNTHINPTTNASQHPRYKDLFWYTCSLLLFSFPVIYMLLPCINRFVLLYYATRIYVPRMARHHA